MKSVSLAEFLRPVEGIDEHAQRVLAQPFGGAWGLDGDGEDRGPARGPGKRAVRIAPPGPGDPKTVIRAADHTRHIDRHLDRKSTRPTSSSQCASRIPSYS